MTAPHILTAEELADRRYPSDIAISADGRFVAFVVQPMGKREEHDLTEIWLSRDGAPARQFSSGLAGDTSPVFSPDSAKLAFLSDRHEREKQRVYVMPLDGGEAMRVSTLEGKLTALTWSPDGPHLGVLVTDPETEAEKKRKEERNDPILENQNLKYSRLWAINAETGVARQLTFGDRQCWITAGRATAKRSPSRHRPEPMSRLSSRMSSLAGHRGGGRLRLLATVRGLPSNLIFVDHPDGEQIAMRYNGFTSDPVDSIWLMSTTTGERRELLTDDHGNVDAIMPIPGEPGQIGMRMVDGVHANAWIIDVATGERTKALGSPPGKIAARCTPARPSRRMGRRSRTSGPTRSRRKRPTSHLPARSRSS